MAILVTLSAFVLLLTRRGVVQVSAEIGGGFWTRVQHLVFFFFFFLHDTSTGWSFVRAG